MSLAVSLVIQIALAILSAIIAHHPELKTNSFIQALVADLTALHGTAKAG